MARGGRAALVRGDRPRHLESRAVGVALPAALGMWLLTIWAVPRLEKHLPPLQTLLPPPRPFALGRVRFPLEAPMLAMMGVLVGVPLASLVWKAGLQGWPPAWSG